MDSHSAVGTGGAIMMIVALLAIGIFAELANYWDKKNQKVSGEEGKEPSKTGDPYKPS
ncbi:MAG: hypothetical protein AB1649_27455 [Chloroflexota bacterium]